MNNNATDWITGVLDTAGQLIWVKHYDSEAQSITTGQGYGAKSGFDLHPLKYPSRPQRTLKVPESFKRLKIPLPHYHRGRGMNLR